MLALAAVIAEVVRALFAIIVDCALCIVFQEERLPNLRPAKTSFIEFRALVLACHSNSNEAQPQKNDLLDHFRRKSYSKFISTKQSRS